MFKSHLLTVIIVNQDPLLSEPNIKSLKPKPNENCKFIFGKPKAQTEACSFQVNLSKIPWVRIKRGADGRIDGADVGIKRGYGDKTRIWG